MTIESPQPVPAPPRKWMPHYHVVYLMMLPVLLVVLLIWLDGYGLLPTYAWSGNRTMGLDFEVVDGLSGRPLDGVLIQVVELSAEAGGVWPHWHRWRRRAGRRAEGVRPHRHRRPRLAGRGVRRLRDGRHLREEKRENPAVPVQPDHARLLFGPGWGHHRLLLRVETPTSTLPLWLDPRRLPDRRGERTMTFKWIKKGQKGRLRNVAVARVRCRLCPSLDRVSYFIN